MLTAAKRGVGASRVFHHDARLPWGSVSMMATGPALLCSASTAKWAVSVVLPLPPFCDAIVSIRIYVLTAIRLYVNKSKRTCVMETVVKQIHKKKADQSILWGALHTI